MLKFKKLTVVSLFLLLSSSFYAQTVVNGVATYTEDKNIGRKFRVPDSWNKILIKENVTITGSFYMGNRSKAIEIAGESRKTSIIQGDGSRPTDDGIKGRSYSAIRCDASPDVYIHDLKITKPMKFHIHAGFGNVTVERCDIIAGTHTFTTDGIHGGKGKTIVRDCYIDCYDDALYTIECKLVENTTIVHNKNGGPFMTSWGSDVPKNHTCIIRNCTVIDNYEKSDYNHGVFSWAQKHDAGNQTIRIKFEGTFTYKVSEGSKPSTMYTIGRPGTSGIKDAHIVIDGECPRKESIEIRGNTNSTVSFINCPAEGCQINDVTAEVKDASCGNADGEISFSFNDDSDKTSIQFSVDGGQTFSNLVNDNTGSYTVSNLDQGNYSCFVRYGDEEECLTNLGAFSVNCTGSVAVEEGIYYMEARHSNKFLEVQNSSVLDGGNIQQQADESGENKQWQITNYAGEWYAITNRNSNKAMEVANSSMDNRGNIQQATLTNADNQLWKFVNPDGDWYQVVSKSSGKVLDVAGVSAANGANIQQWELQENRNNQQFALKSTTLTVGDFKNDLSNIIIYPNPASTDFTLKLNNVNNNDINLKIYSITGALVASYHIEKTDVKIPVENLKQGIYVVRINSDHQVLSKLLTIK